MKIGRRVIPNTLILLILVGLGTGAYLAVRGEQSPSQETTQADEASETAANEGAGTVPVKQNPPGSNETSQPSPPVSGKKTVNPVITFVGQNGSTVTVRATVTEAGTCRLVFSKSGYANMERTASTELVTSYYGCKGFDVDSSAFPVKGEWTARVHFSSGTAEGASNEEKINVS